jgi:hypothetical protein
MHTVNRSSLSFLIETQFANVLDEMDVGVWPSGMPSANQFTTMLTKGGSGGGGLVPPYAG